MRVLVFRHEPSDSAGWLVPALQTRGADWRYVDLWDSSQTATPAADADALIFLGGSMSANDSLDYLRTELYLIERALHRNQPVLGLCLGAQLLAKALGAAVRRNPVPEVGWLPVHRTPCAASDPLFRWFQDSETVLQWHQDTFDLPRGSIHLASSAACGNQAFRHGNLHYGLQFHLEVTQEILDTWQRGGPACGDSLWPAAPIESSRANHMETLATKVFSEWLSLL